MNLFIANIDWKVRDEDLRELFESAGEVSSARIVKDRNTGRSKGYGFVEMPNDDEGRTAIASLNGKMLGAREIVVNEARPREEGNGGRSSYGDRD